jgi:hypothetical protein
MDEWIFSLSPNFILICLYEGTISFLRLITQLLISVINCLVLFFYYYAPIRVSCIWDTRSLGQGSCVFYCSPLQPHTQSHAALSAQESLLRELWWVRERPPRDYNVVCHLTVMSLGGSKCSKCGTWGLGHEVILRWIPSFLVLYSF